MKDDIRKRFFDETKAGREVDAARSFEDRSMRRLLATFKIAKRERQLRDLNERELGRGDLTFYAFRQQYPTFPVILGSDQLWGIKLHADQRAFLPKLFMKFALAPFVEPYERFYNDVKPHASGRSVGLIFPRKGIRGGLVLHDGEDLDPRVFRGTVLTYRHRNAETKEWYSLFLQPFQNLLDSLYRGGHGWRP